MLLKQLTDYLTLVFSSKIGRWTFRTAPCINQGSSVKYQNAHYLTVGRSLRNSGHVVPWTVIRTTCSQLICAINVCNWHFKLQNCWRYYCTCYCCCLQAKAKLLPIPIFSKMSTNCIYTLYTRILVQHLTYWQWTVRHEQNHRH